MTGKCKDHGKTKEQKLPEEGARKHSRGGLVKGRWKKALRNRGQHCLTGTQFKVVELQSSDPASSTRTEVLFTGWVTLNNFLCHTKPSSLICKWDNNGRHLIGILCRLNEMMSVKPLA